MNKLSKIQEEIRTLYHENPDEMAGSWLYDSHVKIVANFAKKVAKSAEADVEICILAALLHDIARVKGVWDDPELMNKSLEMSAEIMSKYGYDNKKIRKVK